jgi:hypothetical protein
MRNTNSPTTHNNPTLITNQASLPPPQ